MSNSTGSLEMSDKAAADVQKTPHRVTLEAMNEKVSGEYFCTAYEAVDANNMPALDALKYLTLCIIVMKNGYTLVGKSAPADPGNFNAELGKKFAREDAIRQLWPLEGYALREKLSA
jgi:hypothetical protein